MNVHSLPIQQPAATLSVRGLSVSAANDVIAGPLDLDMIPGRPLTLLGETGAGKSLVAQAILGALPEGLSADGEIHFGDKRLDRFAPSARRALWGRDIAMLPQEPWMALDPTMRVGAQVAETHRMVAGRDSDTAKAAAGDALHALDVGHASHLYPHQLSGGMAQRVAFAAAMAGGAHIVIADEPTKGLDATLRNRVAALLRSVTSDGNGLLLTITHDPALARVLGGDVALMQGGRLVERGSAQALLTEPSTRYGRALVAAQPSRWPSRQPCGIGERLLSCERLSVARAGRFLVRDLEFTIHAGERIAVTGPSGSGKSSLLDTLAGLLPPAAGCISRSPAVGALSVQKLYQDPPAAFARAIPLAKSLRDVERLHRLPKDRIPHLLDRLDIDRRILARPPASVSGGELQRIALARILAIRPSIILADEPTSRLDLITQERLMNLLAEAAEDTGAAVILVTHDPDIAERWADRTISL